MIEWIGGGQDLRRLMVRGRNLGHVQGVPTPHAGTEWHAWANGESLGIFGSKLGAMEMVERALIRVDHLSVREAPVLNRGIPPSPEPVPNPVDAPVKLLSERLEEKEAEDALAKEIADRAGVSLEALAEGLGRRATDAEIRRVAEAVVDRAGTAFEPILNNAELEAEPLEMPRFVKQQRAGASNADLAETVRDPIDDALADDPAVGPSGVVISVPEGHDILTLVDSSGDGMTRLVALVGRRLPNGDYDVPELGSIACLIDATQAKTYTQTVTDNQGGLYALRKRGAA